MGAAARENKQLFKDGKVVVSPTPVVLAYFAEKGKGTRESVTRAVFNVAAKMEGTNLYMDADFRGHLKSPNAGPIKSEMVDNELWYWFSNNFLIECSVREENDFCFEISSQANQTIKNIFKDYKISNLDNNLKEINWGKKSNRKKFIHILSEVIPSAD
jgi:hypothetical protein